MEKRYESIDRIIEVGVYLYIVFMFLTKGESIRNILIFGNFILWLSTLKYRKNLHILREPVSIFFWLFSGLTIFSVFFSIDPFYSFFSLRNDPLKPALLFIVIATVMSDRKRLERMIYIACFMVLFIVLTGYYSFFFHDIEMLRADTTLMHTGNTGHNRFARYLNTLLPFMLPLYFLWNKRRTLKALLTVALIVSIFALILSTSREGYLAFVGMVFVLAVYLAKTRGYNLFKMISGVAAVILLLGALSWSSFPHVRERMARTVDELPTLNLRTEVWGPAIYAIKERPLFGWGHGRRIFHMDKAYESTPYKKAPVTTSESSPRSPHNTFIKILFHQGIVGFMPYMLLILIAIKSFWEKALKTTGIRSYVLVACVSVLIGNYILNSMLADLQLRYLAVVLGLGMAAKGMDENSHN